MAGEVDCQVTGRQERLIAKSFTAPHQVTEQHLVEGWFLGVESRASGTRIGAIGMTTAPG
jgi:hypothetical protein